MRMGMKSGPSKFKALKIAEEDAPLIAKLPDDWQEALAMSGTYEARAVKLGVAIGTIKSRLNRARAALMAARDADAVTP